MIILSSQSQTADNSQGSEKVAKKKCQTADGVVLEKEEYEALVKKASLCIIRNMGHFAPAFVGSGRSFIMFHVSEYRNLK